MRPHRVRVRRRRIRGDRERPFVQSSCQAVPDTPHGFDDAVRAELFELAAQLADVDVDDVAGALKIVIPDALEYLRSREGDSRVSSQQLEQPELGGTQVERLTIEAGGTRADVDAKLPDFDSVDQRAIAAAQDRAQPGDQLFFDKRFDEVIVGAAIETGNPIFDRIARGEHENRRLNAFGARLARDVEAVHAG